LKEIELASTGGGGGGADGVIVADNACEVVSLVVAYVNTSGVVVDSSHPAGYVTLTTNCVESSVGETAESFDEMVATASGARIDPAGESVPVKTCV